MGQGRKWHAAEREDGKGGRWCAAQGKHEGLHTAHGRPSGHAWHAEPRWRPSARAAWDEEQRRKPGLRRKESGRPTAQGRPRGRLGPISKRQGSRAWEGVRGARQERKEASHELEKEVVHVKGSRDQVPHWVWIGKGPIQILL